MYSVQILYNEWIQKKRSLFGIKTPYTDFSTQTINDTILTNNVVINDLSQVDLLITQLLYELEQIYTNCIYFAKINKETAKNIIKLEQKLSNKGFNDIIDSLYSGQKDKNFVSKTFKERLERDGYTDKYPYLLGLYKTIDIIIKHKQRNNNIEYDTYISSIYGNVNTWVNYLYTEILSPEISSTYNISSSSKVTSGISGGARKGEKRKNKKKEEEKIKAEERTEKIKIKAEERREKIKIKEQEAEEEKRKRKEQEAEEEKRKREEDEKRKKKNKRRNISEFFNYKKEEGEEVKQGEEKKKEEEKEEEKEKEAEWNPEEEEEKEKKEKEKKEKEEKKNKVYIENAISTYCFFKYFYTWLVEKNSQYLERILGFNMQELVILYNNWEKYNSNKTSSEIKKQNLQTIFTLANLLRTNYKTVVSYFKEYKNYSITANLDSNGIDITGIYGDREYYELFENNDPKFRYLNVNYYKSNDSNYTLLSRATYKEISTSISESRSQISNVYRARGGGVNEYSPQDLALSTFTSNNANRSYITPKEGIELIEIHEDQKQKWCLKSRFLFGSCFNSNIRCSFIRRDEFNKSLMYTFAFISTNTIKLFVQGSDGVLPDLDTLNIITDYRYNEVIKITNITEKINYLYNQIINTVPVIFLINLLNNKNTYQIIEYNTNTPCHLILIEGTNIYVYYKVTTNKNVSIDITKPVTIEECSLYFTFDGQRSIPTSTSNKDKKDGFFVMLNTTIAAEDPKKEFKQNCDEKKAMLEQDYSSLKSHVQSDSFWKLSESDINFNIYDLLSGKSNNPALTENLNTKNVSEPTSQTEIQSLEENARNLKLQVEQLNKKLIQITKNNKKELDRVSEIRNQLQNTLLQTQNSITNVHKTNQIEREKLKNKLDEVYNNNIFLQEEKKKLESKILTLNNNIQTQLETIETIKRENTALTKEHANLIQEKGDLERTIIQLKKDNGDVNIVLEETVRHWQNTQNELQELQEKKEQLQLSNTNLQNELDELNLNIETLNKELNKKERYIDEYRKEVVQRLHKYRRTIEKMTLEKEEEIQKLNDEKDNQIKILREEKDKEIEKLKHENETQLQELIQQKETGLQQLQQLIQQKETELRQLIQEKEQELKQLKDENKTLIQQKETELQQLRQEKETELQQLRQEKEKELQQLIQQKENEITKLRQEKENEITKLIQQKEQELQQLQQLQQLINEKDEKIEELKNEIRIQEIQTLKDEEIKRLIDTKDKEIQELTYQTNELNKELESKNHEIEEITRQLLSTKNRIEEITQTLDNVRNELMSSKDIIKTKEDEIEKNKIEIVRLKDKIKENEITIQEERNKIITKDEEIQKLTNKCNNYDKYVQETTHHSEDMQVLLSNTQNDISKLNKENELLISTIESYESEMYEAMIINKIMHLSSDLREIKNKFIKLKNDKDISQYNLDKIPSIIESIDILYATLTNELDKHNMKELSKYTLSVQKNIEEYEKTLYLINSEIEHAKLNKYTSSDIPQEENLDKNIENLDELPSKEEDEYIPKSISIEKSEDLFTKKKGGRILKSRKFRILSKKSKRLTRRK
jgi:hypothetical protein